MLLALSELACGSLESRIPLDSASGGTAPAGASSGIGGSLPSAPLGSGGVGPSAGGGGSGGSGGPEPPPLVCPQAEPRTERGTASDPAFSEISGLVGSRRYSDRLWAHNDSGDGPHLYALTTSGDYLGRLTLEGAEAVDWEDLALDPGPPNEADHLIIADIGDNAKVRSKVSVYRVPEPALGTSPSLESTSQFERFDFSYPDGPHDAEAVFWDDAEGLLFLVSKESDGTSVLFSAPLMPGTSAQVLSLEGSVQIAPHSENPLVTGADLSPSGRFVALRTYSHVLLWTRAAEETVSEALAKPPCHSFLHAEAQGEAIAWSSDGTHIFTISEQSMQPIYSIAVK